MVRTSEKGAKMGMEVFFYAKTKEGAGKRLQKIIEMLVPKSKTVIFRTTNGLSRRLRRPKPANDLTVGVLLATSRRDLQDILSIRELLGDVRIIMILPDREGETIAKGHSLRPRFITYADSDFEDISAVLKKMLENARHDPKTSTKEMS